MSRYATLLACLADLFAPHPGEPDDVAEARRMKRGILIYGTSILALALLAIGTWILWPGEPSALPNRLLATHFVALISVVAFWGLVLTTCIWQFLVQLMILLTLPEEARKGCR